MTEVGGAADPEGPLARSVCIEPARDASVNQTCAGGPDGSRDVKILRCAVREVERAVALVEAASVVGCRDSPRSLTYLRHTAHMSTLSDRHRHSHDDKGVATHR